MDANSCRNSRRNPTLVSPFMAHRPTNPQSETRGRKSLSARGSHAWAASQITAGRFFLPNRIAIRR